MKDESLRVALQTSWRPLTDHYERPEGRLDGAFGLSQGGCSYARDSFPPTFCKVQTPNKAQIVHLKPSAPHSHPI